MDTKCGAEENEANARLIAAAPEMAELLHRIAKVIHLPRDKDNEYILEVEAMGR